MRVHGKQKGLWRVLSRRRADGAEDRPAEGLGIWPNWFTGKDEPLLRRLTRQRLLRIAEKYADTRFARQAHAAARADAQRADPHGWIGEALAVAGRALVDHPPAPGNWRIRKEALLLLDHPLSVRRGRRWRHEVGRFYQQFMARALDEITTSRPVEGVKLWKIYNMGFVAQSARHCVGFDIHPGKRLRPPLGRGQLEALAETLDVAFVSHIHWDHLHKGFLRMMLDAGKKVVLPASYRPWLSHPGVIRVYSYRRPLRIGGIEVRCYPGWQRLYARNCVYVVRFDGVSIAHNGDNTRQKVYRRLAGVHDVNIVLANCWAGLGRCADLTDPQLVVTGHEHELGHSVSMRAPFRQTYSRLRQLGLGPETPAPLPEPACDFAVLSWGEAVHWRPGGPEDPPEARSA